MAHCCTGTPPSPCQLLLQPPDPDQGRSGCTSSGTQVGRSESQRLLDLWPGKLRLLVWGRLPCRIVVLESSRKTALNQIHRLPCIPHQRGWEVHQPLAGNQSWQRQPGGWRNTLLGGGSLFLMIFIPSDSPGEVFPLIIVLDKATTTGHHSCSVGKHFGVLVCGNVVNVGDEDDRTDDIDDEPGSWGRPQDGWRRRGSSRCQCRRQCCGPRCGCHPDSLIDRTWHCTVHITFIKPWAQALSCLWWTSQRWSQDKRPVHNRDQHRHHQSECLENGVDVDVDIYSDLWIWIWPKTDSACLSWGNHEPSCIERWLRVEHLGISGSWVLWYDQFHQIWSQL